MILDAFLYPLRGPGVVMIFLGALMSVALSFASFAPLLGLIATLLGLGYFTAFYFDVITTTVTGRDEVPDWPGLSDFMDDTVAPLVRLIGVLIISLAPLGVAAYFMDKGQEHRDLAVFCTIAWAALYFPMALLNAVIYTDIVAALPHRVLPDIFRCMPSYLVAVILLGSVIVLSTFITEVSALIPYLGWFLASAISIYFTLVQARIVGMIYRRNQARLES